MPRRRPKKTPPPPLSSGPLARKLAARFPEGALVFCDASRLTHGGLGVVLYATPESVPHYASRQVALAGSNALELQAAVFALEVAAAHWPGQPFALFADNIEAVRRLANARAGGRSGDPALWALFAPLDLETLLAQAGSINWLQGHARSRGNALADALARSAALGQAFSPATAFPRG